MTQLATIETSRALQLADDELIPTLRGSLYPGASDESIKLVIGWCRASGKDPMKRPVHIVPMNVKKLGGGIYDKEWRDVIMPGIVDYRIDAARTGQHAGNEEPTFGPDITTTLGNVQITFPEWCEFVVLRLVEGAVRRFTSGKVRFLETYATQKADSAAPNAMWRKRPYGQLEKCAEALALRRGFPEVGGAPTQEEMAGRTTFDLDGEGNVLPGDDAGAGAPPAAPMGVQRKNKKPPAAPAPAADDATDVTPKGEAAPPAAAPATAPASAPAATPAQAPAQAPAAAPAAGGDDIIGAGEVAYLKNKANSVGADLQALLNEMGGLVLERLSKTDFAAVKSKLMAM